MSYEEARVLAQLSRAGVASLEVTSMYWVNRLLVTRQQVLSTIRHLQQQGWLSDGTALYVTEEGTAALNAYKQKLQESVADQKTRDLRMKELA